MQELLATYLRQQEQIRRLSEAVVVRGGEERLPAGGAGPEDRNCLRPPGGAGAQAEGAHRSALPPPAESDSEEPRLSRAELAPSTLAILRRRRGVAAAAESAGPAGSSGCLPPPPLVPFSTPTPPHTHTHSAPTG